MQRRIERGNLLKREKKSARERERKFAGEGRRTTEEADRRERSR
jgi:hypothetical protein